MHCYDGLGLVIAFSNRHFAGWVCSWVELGRVGLDGVELGWVVECVRCVNGISVLM